MPPELLRNRRGLTLVEMTISLGAIALAIFGMTSILVHSSRASDRTTTQSDLDTAVAIASERVEGQLMAARTIQIDTDGLGLTFYYPPMNQDGSYSSADPKAVEASSRRLYVSNGNLYSSDAPDRPILTNVPDTDPDTGAALRIFNTGVNAREIEVRLVSQTTTARGCELCSAMTVRIKPRNM